MTATEIVLLLLGAIVRLVPGFLAAFSGAATDEEAIANARASLPAPIPADPDPERDDARRERILGRTPPIPIAGDDDG